MSTSFLMALLYCLLFALLNGGTNWGLYSVSNALDRTLLLSPIQCPYPSTYKLFLAMTFLLPMGAIHLLLRFRTRKHPVRSWIAIPGEEEGSGPQFDLRRLPGQIPILLTMAVSFTILGSELVQISRTAFPLEHFYRSLVQFMEPCPQALDTLGAFLTVGMIGPFIEELFFRGYLLSGLLHRYGRHTPLLAIGAQAFLFGLMHLNPLQFLLAVGAGFTLGYLRLWSGTLLLPVLLHMMINSFQLILLYLFPEIPYADPQSLGPGDHLPLNLLLPAALLFAGGLFLFHRFGGDRGIGIGPQHNAPL